MTETGSDNKIAVKPSVVLNGVTFTITGLSTAADYVVTADSTETVRPSSQTNSIKTGGETKGSSSSVSHNVSFKPEEGNVTITAKFFSSKNIGKIRIVYKTGDTGNSWTTKDGSKGTTNKSLLKQANKTDTVNVGVLTEDTISFTADGNTTYYFGASADIQFSEIKITCE